MPITLDLKRGGPSTNKGQAVPHSVGRGKGGKGMMPQARSDLSGKTIPEARRRRFVVFPSSSTRDHRANDSHSKILKDSIYSISEFSL